MRRPLRARATADGAAAGGGGRLSLARARSWTARLRIPAWRPAPREGASRGRRGDVRLRAAGGARAVAARGCLGAARAGGRLARRGGPAGLEREPPCSRGKRGLMSLTEEGSREGPPRFERRLCRRNRCLGGGFGRGAKPPSEFL